MTEDGNWAERPKMIKEHVSGIRSWPISERLGFYRLFELRCLSNFDSHDLEAYPEAISDNGDGAAWEKLLEDKYGRTIVGPNGEILRRIPPKP
jgi:hypothetical protein